MPFSLGVIRMEDFKRFPGAVLALRREKDLVLHLVSSDGTVTVLLPLSWYAWLRENGRYGEIA